MFCVYIYIWYVICVYMYIYICIYDIHIHMIIHIQIHIHMHMHMHIHMHIHKHIHVYIYIYVQITRLPYSYDQPDPLSILFVSRCCEDVLMDRVVLRGRSSRWHSLECLRPGCASLLRQNRWSLGISDLAFQTRTARVKTWCVYIYMYITYYI